MTDLMMDEGTDWILENDICVCDDCAYVDIWDSTYCVMRCPRCLSAKWYKYPKGKYDKRTKNQEGVFRYFNGEVNGARPWPSER